MTNKVHAVCLAAVLAAAAVAFPAVDAEAKKEQTVTTTARVAGTNRPRSW